MAPFPSYTKTWHTSTYPAISPTRPALSLAGKTVVVTGGGAGIGLAISKSLAQAGVSRLAIIGRRAIVLDTAAASIHKLAGGKTQVLTISADVSNKTQIDQALAQISKAFGKIDILVPNAGNFTGIRPFRQETVNEWDRNLDINVKGVYLVASAFIAHAAENAKIINISTAMIHLPHFGGFSSYTATKIAGANIMIVLAKEHPELHIVNVHPGQVSETEMAGKIQGMGHIDDADLAGDFVVWLASEEAKFLKGKFIWVNWDVEELKANAKEIESTSLLTIQLEGSSNFKY